MLPRITNSNMHSPLGLRKEGPSKTVVLLPAVQLETFLRQYF